MVVTAIAIKPIPMFQPLPQPHLRRASHCLPLSMALTAALLVTRSTRMDLHVMLPKTSWAAFQNPLPDLRCGSQENAKKGKTPS
jgi:hypothetical protein